MSTIVRFCTLLIIAAAGFALPMTCAQPASAAEPVAIAIPAIPATGAIADAPVDTTGAQAAQRITQHRFDGLPLDCGDRATPTVAEQPATFATQPFVPGYLVAPFQLAEASTDFSAPPPALVPIESRAGPPEAPPPKPIR